MVLLVTEAGIVLETVKLVLLAIAVTYHVFERPDIWILSPTLRRLKYVPTPVSVDPEPATVPDRGPILKLEPEVTIISCRISAEANVVVPYGRISLTGPVCVKVSVPPVLKDRAEEIPAVLLK